MTFSARREDIYQEKDCRKRGSKRRDPSGPLHDASTPESIPRRCIGTEAVGIWAAGILGLRFGNIRHEKSLASGTFEALSWVLWEACWFSVSRFIGGVEGSARSLASEADPPLLFRLRRTPVSFLRLFVSSSPEQLFHQLVGLGILLLGNSFPESLQGVEVDKLDFRVEPRDLLRDGKHHKLIHRDALLLREVAHLLV